RSLRTASRAEPGELRQRLDPGPDERVLQEFGDHQHSYSCADGFVCYPGRLRAGTHAGPWFDVHLLRSSRSPDGANGNHPPTAVRRIPRPAFTQHLSIAHHPVRVTGDGLQHVLAAGILQDAAV